MLILEDIKYKQTNFPHSILQSVPIDSFHNYSLKFRTNFSPSGLWRHFVIVKEIKLDFVCKIINRVKFSHLWYKSQGMMCMSHVKKCQTFTTLTDNHYKYERIYLQYFLYVGTVSLNITTCGSRTHTEVTA